MTAVFQHAKKQGDGIGGSGVPKQFLHVPSLSQDRSRLSGIAKNYVFWTPFRNFFGPIFRDQKEAVRFWPTASIKSGGQCWMAKEVQSKAIWHNWGGPTKCRTIKNFLPLSQCPYRFITARENGWNDPAKRVGGAVKFKVCPASFRALRIELRLCKIAYGHWTGHRGQGLMAEKQHSNTITITTAARLTPAKRAFWWHIATLFSTIFEGGRIKIFKDNACEFVFENRPCGKTKSALTKNLRKPRKKHRLDAHSLSSYFLLHLLSQCQYPHFVESQCKSVQRRLPSNVMFLTERNNVIDNSAQKVHLEW